MVKGGGGDGGQSSNVLLAFAVALVWQAARVSNLPPDLLWLNWLNQTTKSWGH